MTAARVLLVAALVAIGVAGCPKPTPAPVNPDAADAGLAPLKTCTEVCDHAQAMGCVAADDCREICDRVKRKGWRRCAWAAESCAQLDDCGGS